ncbi:ThiF family adenylyltransferase [Cellulomonas sp. PhB143]|uniref:ThiF family adenylyltransferase n=1 Tax=Cellulomonas sp. PhB143 TaxID=2485186 RepID=UPI000F45F25C|nr:ThiF family adenylyltransferase [Cellulomonas sp. PhB143]ROS76866.1 ThiF family protein [Cellulomonas sp. PhB143]
MTSTASTSTASTSTAFPAPGDGTATPPGARGEGPRGGPVRRVLRHGSVVVRYEDPISGAPGVQLGVDDRWAVRLPGLTPHETRWLQLLARRADADPWDAAGTLGLDPGRARRLWSALDAAGALVPDDAPHPDTITAPGRGAADARALGQVQADRGGGAVLARRAGRRVGVVGLGRQGLAIAVVLASAGVGTLVLADPGVVQLSDVGLGGYRLRDVGTPREAAARRVVTDVAAVRTPARLGADGLDAAVVVTSWVSDPHGATRLMNDGVPHLSVVVGEAGVSIGPTVRPGSTPCLGCVELARADRDEGWPAVAPRLRERARLEATDESSTAAVAAGIAAAQVLTLLDGDATWTSGAVVDVLLPGAVPRTRDVAPHPACGCGAFAVVEERRARAAGAVVTAASGG